MRYSLITIIKKASLAPTFKLIDAIKLINYYIA